MCSLPTYFALCGDNYSEDSEAVDGRLPTINDTTIIEFFFLHCAARLWRPSTKANQSAATLMHPNPANKREANKAEIVPAGQRFSPDFKQVFRGGFLFANPLSFFLPMIDDEVALQAGKRRKRRILHSFKELTPTQAFNPRTFFYEMLWKSLINAAPRKLPKPDHPNLREGRLALTQIGHDSFLMQFTNLNTLIDPTAEPEN